MNPHLNRLGYGTTSSRVDWLKGDQDGKIAFDEGEVGNGDMKLVVGQKRLSFGDFALCVEVIMPLFCNHFSLGVNFVLPFFMNKKRGTIFKETSECLHICM